MAENLNFRGIIMGFLVVIVGVLLVAEVADAVFDNVNLSTETNESVEINGSRNIGITSNINETNFFARFALNNNFTTVSGIVMANGTVLTKNTDWNETGGFVLFINTSKLIDADTDTNGNLTLVSYTYEPVGYVAGSSIARTLLSLVPLFFVIGILMFLIKESGVLENLIDRF